MPYHAIHCHCHCLPLLILLLLSSPLHSSSSRCRRPTRTLWCSRPERILRQPWEMFEVSHAAGTGCLPPLRLLAPVVYLPISPRPCIHIAFGGARRTFTDASGWITAGRAIFLLDVKRSTTWRLNRQLEFRYSFPPAEGIDCLQSGNRDIPHRLHRVCVLLWRLPKLEVPFAGSELA